MSNKVVPDKKTVFLIHGRDDVAKAQMTLFLRALGLVVRPFAQVSADAKGSKYVGNIIRLGMDQAWGIVALFTPDEWSVLAEERRSGSDKPNEVQHWVARQNLLFETGMALGMEGGEDRTVVVVIGDVELPSDMTGRHVVRMNNSADRREELKAKLAGIGCTIDPTVTGSHDPATAGDFDKCGATPTKPVLQASTGSAIARPRHARDERWDRCGSVYWLGNNVVFSALALTQGDAPGAARELKNAIHHAQQLPITRNHLGRLLDLQKADTSTPSAIAAVALGLVKTGSDMGIYIGAHQPDFDEVDVRERE